MPNMRKFDLCFSRIKRPLQPQSPQTPDNHNRPLTTTATSSLTTNIPDAAPDFAAILASQRFFFTSPGRSNSITESTIIAPPEYPILSNSMAVPTYSPDPYMDFRRSMQEMVKSRGLIDVKSNWDYLHELLLCYLALNPKSTHKFIFGAFAHLLLSLMSPASEGDRRESDRNSN